MKNSISSLSSRTIIYVVVLLTLSTSVEGRRVPWHLDTVRLWQDYRAAVADARTAESSEICHSLPIITSTGGDPRIEWINQGSSEFVLVCSMMAAGDSDKLVTAGDFSQSNSLVWVTIPYDFEEHLRRTPICTDSLECRMRMVQLLGLPPDCMYDRLVFFYAECSRLLRPSPDPEINDSEASLNFSPNAPEHYRKWFEQNRVFSYESDTPYPWTRLGYTYDWSRKSKSKVGPAEFLVHTGAKVQIVREVNAWEWYQTTFKGH